MRRRSDLAGQPRVRSIAAQAAWNRNGGAHGGTAKQQLKRARRDTKVALRKDPACT